MAQEMEDIHVAVIELQQSVVIRGIKNKLQELHFKVTEIGNDVKEACRYSGQVDSLILYLSETMISHAGVVNDIKGIIETVDHDDQKMILIGEKDFLDDITKKIPDLRMFERLLLPVDLDSLGKVVKGMIEYKDDGAQKRVLIVDDDPAYAKMVREWISDAFIVNVVTSGMHAITFLTKASVDLILLDYEMPVVDGPQVFEMIKSEPEMADIPVVFLTGNGTREGVQRVMQLGPAGYVLKGASKQELITKIKNVLAKRV